MAAFAPSAEDLATFCDVDSIAAWLEVEPPVLEALAAAVGARTRTLRTWARIPAARWADTVTNMKITSDLGVERALSPIEEGQVGELRDILARMAQTGPPLAIGEGGRAGGQAAEREGGHAGGQAAGSADGTLATCLQNLDYRSHAPRPWWAGEDRSRNQRQSRG